jgi:hypothetical protein
MLTVKEFKKTHPWPDESGINSLYKFMSINAERLDFVEHLFLESKIYHALAESFNDPFEGKPQFKLDGKLNNAKRIRDHLVRVARINKGLNYKKAQALVNESMKEPNFLSDAIESSNEKQFKKLRITCFTTSKDNLLFWAHYAKSHKGFCVEFDASIMPISMAFKVHYSCEYPQITYPIPADVRAFRTALVKSIDWEYEQEYRSIFTPGITTKLHHDKDSLFIQPNTIKAVYLGAKMPEKEKSVLLDIIHRSVFNPEIWQASLSKSSFSLEFTKIE